MGISEERISAIKTVCEGIKELDKKNIFLSVNENSITGTFVISFCDYETEDCLCELLYIDACKLSECVRKNLIEYAFQEES